MKLSVIIVNYNVRYYVEQCVNSVERATRNIDTEIFIVDNDSRDHSVHYLHNRLKDRVEIIESSYNLGFARANNMAIRQSDGDYILLLNPDTIVGENSIKTVLDFMESHPKAGGVGVKMHNSNGSLAKESRRAIPTPFVSLLKMLGLSTRYYMSRLSWDEPGQIEIISGAFCMVRREVVDTIGGLDKDFFMYGEDIDFSYRILKAGYENWYVPANILHYKGESTQKTSYRYVHVFYQAMIKFFRKHYGHLSFLITIPIKLAIYLRAFLALLTMEYVHLHKKLGLTFNEGFSTIFCFVGSSGMLGECKKIARRKGLEASFCKSLDDIQPCDVLVYDTEMFSYEEIIKHANKHAGSFNIGTYSRRNHILITPTEVIVGS